MKKLITTVFISITVSLSSCEILKSTPYSLIPSEFEMAMGLKDALSQGLVRSFNAFADPNTTTLVRFIFPGETEKIEKKFRGLGNNKIVDDVIGNFTRATRSAVNAANPNFLAAVNEMSISNAVNIVVTDNKHAATDYYKETMKPVLMVVFRPIVENAIKTEGADKSWSEIINYYNRIPFIDKQPVTSLTDLIAARAIDGLFRVVADEEERIRTNYEFRKTDMMKKVFGYAEEELKRRAQQKK